MVKYSNQKSFSGLDNNYEFSWFFKFARIRLFQVWNYSSSGDSSSLLKGLDNEDESLYNNDVEGDVTVTIFNANSGGSGYDNDGK